MTTTTIQPTPGFLPAPGSPPRPRDLPDSDLVATLAGPDLAEPLTWVEKAYAAAEAAVRALVDNRPGGVGFREALDGDVADRVAGKSVKRLRVDVLVEGDRGRWAEAHVATRAATDAARQARGEVDRGGIGKAARGVTEKAAAEWQAAAAAGWAGRGDQAVAWQRRRDGEAALGRYLSALRVWEWATGTPGPDLPSRREVRIPDLTDLPSGPVARGQWLALQLVTEPTTTWLHLPNEVVFPDGAENLVMNAIPENADRWTALRGPGYATSR